MSFLWNWFQTPGNSIEESKSFTEDLTTEDQASLKELMEILGEEETYEATGQQIIRHKTNQLFNNFADKYPHNQELYSQVISILTQFEEKHEFYRDVLSVHKPTQVTPGIQQEVEEEKQPQSSLETDFDQDILTIEEIQNNLTYRKLTTQAKGINDLQLLIQTRPDLANLTIELYSDILANLSVMSKFESHKILDYPKTFENLNFKGNQEGLKLLTAIEDNENSSQAIQFLKDLKVLSYPFFAAHQILHKKNDYVACPHLVRPQVKKFMELFAISHHYTLEDLTTFQSISSKDEQVQLVEQWARKFTEENSFSLLLPIFFHLLKRCENWNSIIRILISNLANYLDNSQSELFSLNQKICFLLIFSNSETTLQIRMLQLYSQFNPVPLLYRSLKENCNFEVNDKVYYCLDKSEGVFSFSLGKLASYKCGKSTILNAIFQTNFETQDENVLSFGTIDINFDHNFVPSRQISIADGHGRLEKCFLELFAYYFNTLLIHVHINELTAVHNLPQHSDHDVNYWLDYADQQNITLQEVLKQSSKTKNIIILIRDCHQHAFKGQILLEKEEILNKIPETKTLLKLLDYQSQLKFICLKNIEEMSSEQAYAIYSQIRRVIYKSIFTEKLVREPDFNIKQQNQYEEEKNPDIKKIQEYNVNPNSFANLLSRLAHTEDVIKVHKHSYHFLTQLLQYQDDFYSSEAFPSRTLMKTLRSCENDLKNSNLTKSRMAMLEKLKKDTENQLKNLKMTECISKFIEVLSLDQAMAALIQISQTLKIQVEANITHLLQEKTKLYQLNKDKKDSSLNAQIDNISIQIDKQCLSIEHIWREVFYMYESNKSNFINYNISLKESIRSYVMAGEPFEIIDGDNLYFSKDSIAEILDTPRLRKQKVLIISILGPQSSGKSTLLNQMFGCLFATSAGRCTKGIYGSFISLKGDPHYDSILLINSEGLLSSEKNDSEFDRKITCFVLAISHIVLINVKGDLHLPMQNLLEICTLNLHELRQNKIEMPLVYFVFNQSTDLEKTKFMSQIDNIRNNILNANELAQDAAQIFKPDQNLIKPLPLAYKLE